MIFWSNKLRQLGQITEIGHEGNIWSIVTNHFISQKGNIFDPKKASTKAGRQREEIKVGKISKKQMEIIELVDDVKEEE